MSIVGVTGTNGKTTVTYLLESVFRAAGWVPGVIGTTGVKIDGEPVPFPRTTPEAPDLHALLARMVDRGVQAVAMEVSSHGLHPHRADGISFRVGELDVRSSLRGRFNVENCLATVATARLLGISDDASTEGIEAV